MRICAIHQPNFFPWLGYFHKIVACDVFIILDDVLISKTGSSWTNRCALKMDNKKKWMTLPLVRPSGTVSIHETKTNSDTKWRKSLKGTIRGYYGKTPFFKEIYPVLSELIDFPGDSLCSFNINALSQIAALLGIDHTKKFVKASDLAIESASTQRLVDLTLKVGADAYISGGGASGYQKDELFEANSIRLIYQNFKHPIYQQIGNHEFIPGLSIIDALFNSPIEDIKMMLSEQPARC